MIIGWNAPFSCPYKHKYKQYLLFDHIYMSVLHSTQQHPPLFLPWIFLPLPLVILVVPPWSALFGYEVATLALISRVIRVKASSTFIDSLADVSKNRTLKLSASSLPSWYGTSLYSSRSFLLPTKILEIFSWACLSTSVIHSLTLANVSLSVKS